LQQVKEEFEEMMNKRFDEKLKSNNKGERNSGSPIGLKGLS